MISPLQPSIETLRGFGAFTKVITLGDIYERKPLKAFVYPSISKQKCLRVGFAVTRRVRKATQRNLLKRMMREAFRVWREEFYENLNFETAVDIVFLYNGDIGMSLRKDRFKTINQAVKELSSTINYFCSK